VHSNPGWWLKTGRHVIHSGIYDPDCSPGTTLAVPLNFTMLPAHLKTLGYSTAAIGEWQLLPSRVFARLPDLAWCDRPIKLH
jgi:arylsulfatase A-like enzyme